MRLIDLDELINFIKANGMVYADTLDKFPTVEAAPVVHGEWISVKERLPEKPGYYLVAVDMEKAIDLEIECFHSNPEIMYFKPHYSKWETSSVVTHWMPLPPPPEPTP